MKYLLLICTEGPEPAGGPGGSEAAEVSGASGGSSDGGGAAEQGGMTVEEWVAEMDGRGIRKFGERVRPAQDATTVRVRAGELLITDGPFAETKEQMAGFDVIECADLDEAVEVASKHPMARHGMIDVRPFWPFE